MSGETIVVPSAGITLAELYNADRRTRDRYAFTVAAQVPIPHPLTGVEYADGVKLDTTAGHVACVACAIGRPCVLRRNRSRAWWQTNDLELSRLSAHLDGVEA